MKTHISNIVTIIVPCYNEYNYITPFLKNIESQTLPFSTELIIIDGGSTDGTIDILKNYKTSKFKFRLIEHNKKFVPISLNLGILSSKGDIIIRLDVHTIYDNNYIYNSVKLLLKYNYQCVGGPWRSNHSSFLQKAISFAFQSKICSGGALSRDINYSGFVDSVYLGCWKKDYLVNIGLFDERLIRNQDDELCLRIRNNGGRVYQHKSIKSYYYPRSKYSCLFNQYFQYGFWRHKTQCYTNRLSMFRHLLPVFITLFLLFSIILVFNKFYIFIYLYISFYLCPILITLLYGCKSLLLLPFSLTAVLIMHHSYGIGYISSFISHLFKFKFKFAERLTR